ncbi:S41 family peptidase [Paenibacillus sp. y28]|uniref:S41 family peptidase n=1 Tax=Paenibacillus sp. y28 TaxID=3129110 RepID=UPI00301A9CCB
MFKKTFSVLLVSTVTAVQLLVAPAAFAAQKQETAQTQLNEVYELIGKLHVSGISNNKLTESAIQGMISTLDDPYTVYMNADEFKRFNDDLEQNYVGIGVRVGEDEQGMYITEVFSGSSAEGASLQPGDYVTAVEGQSVIGLPSAEIINQITGTEGTFVNVTFQRGTEAFTKKLERKAVKVPVVTSSLLSGHVGYIRVSSFSQDADELFAQALAELKKQGARSLVLDLRDNGGGLLDTAQNLAKQFFREGVLMNTKDRDNIGQTVTVSGGQDLGIPAVVLVNSYSASASEVLTGALQDYDIAKIIGTRTFGKGSVQSVHMLSGGAVLKITIEEYMTPKLRQVNKKGLEPDVLVENSEAQLVTALWEAGADQVSVTADKHYVEVNGLKQPDTRVYLEQDAHVYAPVRLLAALAGATVKWNEEENGVELLLGDSSTLLPMSAEYMQFAYNGAYIDVAEFASRFPQLEWSKNGEQLRLAVKGK